MVVMDNDGGFGDDSDCANGSDGGGDDRVGVTEPW